MSDPEITVRPARPEDAEQFAAVLDSVAGEGRWVLTEHPFDAEAFAERVRDTLAAGEDALFVAQEPGGRIVANLGLHVGDPGPVTLGMALLPEVRGRGLGRRMLHAAIEHARTRDWHKISLEVFPDNERAIRLYRAAGFEVEGRLRAHYRRRDGSLRDVLVMGLLLET